MATATFDLVDQDSLPMVGITVRVYDSANATLLDEGVTDVAGSVDFTLSSGRYYARFYPTPPQATVDSPRRFTVIDPGVNIFDIVGWVFKHPTSPYPGYCLISGYFVDAHGEPLRGQIIRLIPQWDPSSLAHPAAESGPLGYFTKPQSVSTDEDGYVEFRLPRNMGCILATIAGYEDWSVEVGTPDSSWCDVVDFIFPQASALTWDPAGPLAMAVDDEEEVEPLLLLSNQMVLDGSTDKLAVEMLDFESSDPLVATTRVHAGNVRVTAVAVGTATITATPKPGVFTARLPEQTFTVTPLSVVVT